MKKLREDLQNKKGEELKKEENRVKVIKVDPRNIKNY